MKKTSKEISKQEFRKRSLELLENINQSVKDGFNEIGPLLENTDQSDNGEDDDDDEDD